MKTMKRIFALVCAMVMTLAVALPASAASITIKDGSTGNAVYEAYKLFDATDLGDNKFTYTVNGKYEEILKAVAGEKAEENVTDVLGYISALDTAGIRAFADGVYSAIKVAELQADASSDNKEFSNIAQGYYLVAEATTNGATDTYSLVMLDTAGQDNITITTKEDVPTLEKKVQETNDTTGDVSGWQDGADYDVNDYVPFQLTGTVAAQYDEYNTYYYAFHDVMSAGLTFIPNSVKVKVGGTVITEGYEVVVGESTGESTNALPDGCTFEVRFADLKEIPTVTATSTITVDYTAILNENAVIGSEGNPNTASLEYSNNPYVTSDEDNTTSKTPEDTVIVFTYQVIANKVDGSDNNAPLEGAEFTLSKYRSEGGEYVPVEDSVLTVSGEKNNIFTFSRLDAGRYKLEETVVPSGYNKADDIYFEVAANYDTDAADPKFGELTVTVVDANGTPIEGVGSGAFTVDSVEGSVSTNIVNMSGTELPSTGGIGTKIFYVVGAIIMIGAAILFFRRRRVEK